MARVEPISAQLLDKRIVALYHFTHLENLRSIAEEGGLCSKHELQRNGRWPCPHAGGDELSHQLDRVHRNWDLVPLTFTTQTPMFWHRRRDDLCVFVVDARVVDEPGVWFTDANATKTGHLRDQGPEGASLVDVDVILGKPRPWDPGWLRSVQAEVLVPRRIDLSWAFYLAFKDEEQENRARGLLAGRRLPRFEVRRQLFPTERERA